MKKFIITFLIIGVILSIGLWHLTYSSLILPPFFEKLLLLTTFPFVMSAITIGFFCFWGGNCMEISTIVWIVSYLIGLGIYALIGYLVGKVYEKFKKNSPQID